MIDFATNALVGRLRPFRSAQKLKVKIRTHYLNDIGFEPDQVGKLVRFLEYSRDGHKDPYTASNLERRCQRLRPVLSSEQFGTEASYKSGESS